MCGQSENVGRAAVRHQALVGVRARRSLRRDGGTCRPVRIYRIIASIVLIFSLAGPVGSGVDTSSRLVLLGMHLTVGAALRRIKRWR
jgi:hypothetical protein